MRIGLSCQSNSKKAYKNKYPYLNEEPFESSSDPSYYKTKEMFHKENISFKLPFSEQDSSQEEEIDEYLYENSYADIKHRSSFSKEDFEIRKRSYSDYSFSEIKISSSEIKTSSYYLKSISDNESIRWSSLDSKSKNLSEFIKKEEHKTWELKYSDPNNTINSEEIDSCDKYSEEEIKDLIDEAEQAVYTQRKRYSLQFKYETLSEYFIKNKLYKLKLWDLNDPLLYQYDLSDFGEFIEFASDPRWKDQILISPKYEITVKLNQEKANRFLPFIKMRLCEFKTLDLEISEEECWIIRKFLANYFPASCQFFKLSSTFQRPRIDYYFNSIINLSNRVINELYILRWKLSQQQMMTIFKEFKHVRSLKICFWTLSLESVPEFGTSLEGPNIKELALRGNDYGDNGYGIEHLIQGLSQSSDFIQNLYTINLHGPEITEEEAEEKLKIYVDVEKLKFDLFD